MGKTELTRATKESTECGGGSSEVLEAIFSRRSDRTNNIPVETMLKPANLTAYKSRVEKKSSIKTNFKIPLQELEVSFFELVYF